MGYCMRQVESEFFIEFAKKQDALNTLKTMDPKTKGRGFYDGKAQWAWVSQNAVNEARTLEEALEEWGYSPSTDPEGNITDISFNAEKLGDEEHMFKVLAPFVREGSFLEMHGEDGGCWRWAFKDGKMKSVHAKVSWDDE